MDGLDIGSFLDVTRSMSGYNKKISREDAKKEFLKIFCSKVTDKMFSDDLLSVSEDKNAYFKSSMDTSLVKKIFADKLAEQIEKRGNLK